MKVVAFYSFKGGVGRTMSLLSAAYTLAARGRRAGGEVSWPTGTCKHRACR